MKTTVVNVAAMAEAVRSLGRSMLGLGLAGMMSGACSDSGRPVEANDGGEQTNEDPGETTSYSRPNESDADAPDVVTGRENDASVASTRAATSVDVDAALATSSAVSTASTTTESGAPSTDDASVILEPVIDTLTVAELCEQLPYLEGRSVDVDLHDQLVRTDWQAIDFVAFGGDAAPIATDTATDAGTCVEGFAAYSVPCRGNRLIVSAPGLVFGEGPEIGGETVGLGCWQRGCASECVPALIAEVASVRVRVEAPANSSFDEEAGVLRGLARLNGVDLDAIGLLEILSRP